MKQHKYVLATLVLLWGFLAVLGAQTVLQQADDLYWADHYEQAKELLLHQLPSVTNPTEKAEILWRISRATLAIGDELKADGASDDILFATFEEGQEYANEAIATAAVPRGYVYRASNVGRWGETKGPLNSLSKAKPMRDDFTYVIDTLSVMDDTIAWYVLGQLYYKLPGWPISFGDINTAISYTRMAIETISPSNLYHGHFKALAEMLWKRGLSAAKRSSKINSIEKDWNKAKGSTLDRYAYYEGGLGGSYQPFYSPVALNKMSDQQEAVMLLKFAMAKYEMWPFHSRADQRTYKEIAQLLTDWGF